VHAGRLEDHRQLVILVKNLKAPTSLPLRLGQFFKEPLDAPHLWRR